jgi:hypothetical protein
MYNDDVNNILKNKSVTIFFVGIFLAYSLVSFWPTQSATLQNNMNAEYTLGAGGASQDFTVAATGTTASTFFGLTHVYYDETDQKIFVSERFNNRVLIFNTDQNGTPLDHVADYVIGQEDFTSRGDNWDQDGFTNADGLAYDSDRDLLFVSDYLSGGAQDSSRILVFDFSGGITNGMNASYVLGQPNFTATTSPLTSQNTFRHARSLSLDKANDRLYVTDLFRVLVFDVRDSGSAPQLLCGESTTGLATNMNASCVIGQQNFTDEVITTTQSGARWYTATQNYYDPIDKYLYLTDSLNFRTLVFDLSNGPSNGMIASYVLGQSDFTSRASSTVSGASNFLWNGGLAKGVVLGRSNDGNLFVSDSNNSRVMVFDISNGITNNMPASLVIGQPNLTANLVGTAQNRFLGSGEGTYSNDDQKLYVIDLANSRVLIFNLTPSHPESSPT